MTLVVIDTYLPSYSSLHVKQFNFCITDIPKLRNNTQLRRQLVSLHIPCFHLICRNGQFQKISIHHDGQLAHFKPSLPLHS